MGRWTMPHVLIGEITNHTHRLAIQEIHDVVEGWVLAHGGAEAYGELDNVHAAPGEDPKVLTEAVRLWREGGPSRVDFTQYVGDKLYWFGFCHAGEEAASS